MWIDFLLLGNISRELSKLFHSFVTAVFLWNMKENRVIYFKKRKERKAFRLQNREFVDKFLMSLALEVLYGIVF